MAEVGAQNQDAVLSGPEWGDEQWQEDRAVFTREEQTKQLPDGRVVITKVLVVGLDARKHWSDANPRKFDPDTAVRIIQYVNSGCFIETAAAAAGITKVTFYNWLRAGRDPKNPRSTEELRAWVAAMDEAFAMVEARAVSGILQAGAQSWQAYAWYLERVHAARYRQRNSVIPENPDGTPYVGSPAKSSEELIREVAAMQAALKEAEAVTDASSASNPA